MKFLIKHRSISFLILILITFILLYFTNKYILTVDFYTNSDNPLSGIPAQDGQVYDNLQKWIYLSSFLYLLIKIAIISLILYTALYLAENQVTYKQIFAVVTASEYVYLIPAILKLVLFHFVYRHGTLFDWHKFYMLSALSLAPNAPSDWYFALQTINLFEFSYWFILAYGISKISVFNFDRSLQIVVTSYLPALIIWVAVVTFCSLMIFPSVG